MKTYLLKLLVKAAKLAGIGYADAQAADYSGWDRQTDALVAGAKAGWRIAIFVLLFKLASENFADMAHAAHSPIGALLMAILLAAGMVSILINYGTPVLAVFVIASLAYDVYKLKGWCNSKVIALCIGIAALTGVWCWLLMQTEDLLLLSLADLAPFLSSSLALLLMFTVLVILPSPRKRINGV